MPGSERERLIEALVEEYRRTLEERVPHGPQTLDQIEQTVEEIGRQMDRELEQRILEEIARRHRYDNQARCPCGKAARYRATHARQVITLHAEHTLQHRYYYCASCRRGLAPLAVELGLDSGETTVQVRLAAAHLGARLPFEDAAATLRQLLLVQLGASTVERITLAVGKALDQAQQELAEAHRQGRLPQPALKPARLYLGMDGKMIPLREPWRRDGSAGALACRYGECKVGVVYEARQQAGRDKGVRRSTYVATLASAPEFGRRLATQAHRAGQHWAKEVVVLGDGAAWIWGLAATHFPEALQIVDFYHASEHLATLAEARFGVKSEEGSAWIKARQAELLADGIEQVIAAIAAWKPKAAEKRKVRRLELAYFRQNAERMRYGSFRQAGYHIGSGVVEAACKYVAGSRLDAAGMHWRRESAEAVANLRAALLSADAPDLRPYCALAA